MIIKRLNPTLLIGKEFPYYDSQHGITQGQHRTHSLPWNDYSCRIFDEVTSLFSDLFPSCQQE